jgi:hypothetical protein
MGDIEKIPPDELDDDSPLKKVARAATRSCAKDMLLEPKSSVEEKEIVAPPMVAW